MLKNQIMSKTLYTLIVYSENIAGVLNQITAVFTRRQVNIESLNVSASSTQGVHKYTITAMSDEDTISKITKQIEKKIEVLQANYYTDRDVFILETALYKISTQNILENRNISKVVRMHNAMMVEVNPTYSIVEKTGMTDEIISLYEGLKEYDCVIQFVRSGRIAITKGNVERLDAYLADREAHYIASKKSE